MGPSGSSDGFRIMFTNKNICDSIEMISVFLISVFLEFPDFLIWRNMEIPEILKSENTKIMCVCM